MSHTPPDIPTRFLRKRGDVVVSQNERQMLDLMRKAGVMTRADLIRASGLSGPGAKNLIDDLVERGMLRLGTPVNLGRGQPSSTVSLVADYAYAAGLAIAVDGYRMVLIDFTGKPVDLCSWRSFPMGLDAMAAQARADLGTLLARQSIPPSSLFGVGLSMTGPFYGSGRKVNPPLSMPDEWAQTELETYLREALGHPLLMDNDANCAALAEAMYGHGHDTADFVYLHFSDGFAGGVIEGGRLLVGSHGNAGELGRLYAMTGAERPTLEGLRQRLLAAGHGFADLNAMLEAYCDDWPEVGQWVTDVAGGLSVVVAAIVALLDPEAIVFGARLPQRLAERLCAAVRFEVNPRRGLHAPNPRLVPSRVEGDASAIGAAMLPFKTHFYL